ncbi:MAG: hypothetical protein FWB96_11475 [Defluviitaleaceae bacterium]|nr:hypothetical protein [Defluviitaleaceae bacterium]MCL2263683.1 hypothetical protein [Defluviitaleaceae bacterium]
MPSTLSHSKYKVNLTAYPYQGNPINLTPCAESVQWQTSRNLGFPGSIEVTLQKRMDDEKIVIPPGSRLRFGVNGTDLFFGLIEEPELTKEGSGIKTNIIRAVDHLKLLDGVENAYRTEGMTGSDFFLYLGNKFAERFAVAGASFSVREPSNAPLDDYYFLTQTLYSMITDTMTASHVAEAPDSLYMLRDNLGVIEWRELKALRLPIILGDESFISSYNYKQSLSQTYNVIKAIRDNEEIGMRDVWIVEDSSTHGKWWFRQLTWEANENLTEAEIMEINHLKLRAHNRITRHLRGTGIGDFRIQAGTGVQLRLDRANIDACHWCEQVTHTLTAERHKMELEFYV